ncbi:lipase family protein [Mycobacteroides abscessus]|uniref:lipase family protein n=1 Tax=Mycobacteroides abscessus TaxID=36809 RepID=UPI0009A5CDC5|nr:lipase family protein [Mycobacteroides abscessus]SLF93311.1 Probable lipase [Mycobacteroides abscessus subsp. abscessus]
MRWSTGAFAALGGITAAVATGGTALRSPVVVDRLNDWAARRLTVQQRADPYAAILPTPISGDDFYGDPGDLGLLAPGEVVRADRVTPRLPLRRATMQRIMVRSTDTAGNPVPVTAALIEPERPWRGPGSRPVVVRNQAINSLGLKFTPSYRLTHLWYRDNPPMFPFLSAQNYAVLFPDHEGPRMSYAAGKMAGHAVLDSVRGMLSERPDLAESPIVMHGYSGGAIATAWAAQLQPTYAPELRIAGAAAGGTPTDYALLYGSMNRGVGAGLFAAATIGQAREFPELVQIFGDFALYCAIRAKNMPQPPLAAAGLLRFDLDLLAAIAKPFESELGQHVIAANRPGALTPTMPVLLYHGSRSKAVGDLFIPEEGALALRDAWRTNGADVDYWALPGEHVTADMFAIPWVVNWIRRKLLG